MSAPTTPEAAGRLSITTGCPSRSARRGPSRRAVTSLPPPGANGMTRRIGREGYLSCAQAVPDHHSTHAHATMTGIPRIVAMLLGLDSRVADHLGDAVVVVLDERRERRGGAADDVEPELGEALADVRQFADAHGLGIDLRNNCRRGAGRRKEPGPRIVLVAPHAGFRHSRDLRRRGRARGAGGGENSQASGLM